MNGMQMVKPYITQGVAFQQMPPYMNSFSLNKDGATHFFNIFPNKFPR